ncbi:hypothetical protein AZH51_16990 [Branchiibius sp. NY16-3462-2]|nr:hypothetical protein AZH51_16990 [Branchiibius sp. NY16-3462-2]
MRAAQESIVTDLEQARVAADVGPTSATGWSAVWADESVAGLLPMPWVSVAHDSSRPEGRPEVIVRDADGMRHGPEAPPEDVADQLLTLFEAREEDRAGIVEALADSEDADELLDGLSALGLPSMTPADPETMVMVIAGAPVEARFGAHKAGPAWLASLDPQTTLVLPVDDSDEVGAGARLPHSQEVFVTVSTVVGGRRRQLVLWRSADATGFEIWHKGEQLGRWIWNRAWRTTMMQTLDIEPHVVEALAAIAAGPVEAVDLRVLLRRKAGTGTELTELVGLLGLPPGVADLANGRVEPQQVPGAERLERQGMARSMRTALREEPPLSPRPAVQGLYLLYTIGTVLACLIMALVSLTGVVRLTTGESEEWLFLVFSMGMTLLLGWTARYRVRRVLAARRTSPS